MTLLNIFAFTGVMFLLAITPGPGVFATISRALASGFTNASFMVLGIVLGDIIFLLLAIFGLNAIATLLGDFSLFVKYLGGAYLLFLGFLPAVINLHTLNPLDIVIISFIITVVLGGVILSYAYSASGAKNYLKVRMKKKDEYLAENVMITAGEILILKG